MRLERRWWKCQEWEEAEPAVGKWERASGTGSMVLSSVKGHL